MIVIQPSLPAPIPEVVPIIPDVQVISHVVFQTAPDNDQILETVYGNKGIWRASQLPSTLNTSLLFFEKAGNIAFRVAHREEQIDGSGLHRLFVAFAGSGVPFESSSCHACAAILGVVVLRQDAEGWRVESFDRTVTAIGEYGVPASQYSIVRWGADRYGLLLRTDTLHHGITDKLATLIGMVDSFPRVIAEFDLGHVDCATEPCREEVRDMSFVETPGLGERDLRITTRATSGRNPGDLPVDLVRTLRFDGKTYKELPADNQVPTRAAAVEILPTTTPATATASIVEVLSRWRQTTLSEDVSGQLQCYAPMLEKYYLKRNYSRSQVEADKILLFQRFPKFTRYDVTELRMEWVTSARVVVFFRKDWEAFGGTRSAGSVRTELTFELINGEWKIVGEVDRKLKT